MDYEVIGDYVVHYGEGLECHIVSAYTDKLVKSFTGETCEMEGRRWAWDNSLNPHVQA
jgi:hypothetical protein